MMHLMNLPDFMYELNIYSICIRIFLAILLGGIIGLERGATRHAAGFRTHILVCMGAALAMLTNQYIFDVFDAVVDPSRMGAQVITGVGFLGVGTILVTGSKKIKGLTTAAGLWASACLGLAAGIGFYDGAVIGGIAVFISLALLPKLESMVYLRSGVINIYVEVTDFDSFKAFMESLVELGITVIETDLNQPNPLTPGGIGFVLSLKLPRGHRSASIIETLSQSEHVTYIEEQ
jgi:putative Mg2+ transporter-C (MgtC) family protein